MNSKWRRRSAQKLRGRASRTREAVERRWWPTRPQRLQRTRAGGKNRSFQSARAKAASIDPLSGSKYALSGRVVTMNASYRVRNNAVVYIDKGGIVAVRDRAQEAPVGFEHVPIVETQGTIFPGLIELHNHLSYNALPL